MNYELSNLPSPADGNNNDTITSDDTDPRRRSSDNVSHGSSSPSSSTTTSSNSLDGQRDTTSSINTGIDTNESTLSPIHMINSPSSVDMVQVDNVESVDRSQQSSNNQSTTTSPTVTALPTESSGLRHTQSMHRMLPIESARVFGTNSRRTLRGIWDSNTSPFFATLVCCLNFSTICRFAISTYFLKGSFIIQFMLISICFGLPFLLFLMSLGQYLGSGYMDMWFISPVFKGIGIAFMIIYGTIAIYTVVPTSWLLVYLRDSFLTTRDTPYKWSYCNRRFNGERCLKAWNSSASFSDQTHLGWSVSAYFHNSVMGHQDNGSSSTYAKLNVIMNLALLWILTFVILFRGLHNAGRVISFLAIFPLVLFIFVNIRFIEEFGDGIIYLFFSNGKTFLGDSLSWILAARECFMVWTLFGGVIINVYGHSRPTNLLRHTITLFIIVTVILISSACFFASTIQIIISSNLQYIFSSFEKYSLVNFVRDGSKTGSSEPAHLQTASNLLLGENLLDSTDAKSFESNYQVLRWATEIMPIALAIKGPKEISSFWAMTFYLSGVLMNLASHLVLWGSFIDSVIALAPNSLRQTKSTVVFITSFLGFAASVSINSWKNLHIVYFLDSCIGSICWISCLYLVLVVAILVIRGKPCAPYHLVSSLTIDNKLINWLLPTLTLHWTLMLPIILMVLSIFFTRSYRGLNLSWSQVIDDYPYWTPSIRLAWNILQTIPLSVVLIYLPLRLLFMLCMDRDQPIATRLRNLFLPDVVIFEPELTYGHHMGQISTIDQSPPLPDPPPKYSPPPSYSSATSKPLAKQLRTTRLASSITIDLHFLRETDANGDQSEKLPRKKSCLRRKSSNKL